MNSAFGSVERKKVAENLKENPDLAKWIDWFL